MVAGKWQLVGMFSLGPGLRRKCWEEGEMEVEVEIEGEVEMEVSQTPRDGKKLIEDGALRSSPDGKVGKVW